ncbi:nucleotidyltransferase domain-containing protein [uncultured Alistipes sp.]|uniref:nucleotidyltransferase domain-containing protein n=1 Tax=uncultured Alistipes sp. TaxID=538949 RepID=UPI002614D97F|nr:nucleotidyltransferase domain-containing protein [uncultured Alistipes sp.]
MDNTQEILTLAAANQRRAGEILDELRLRELWQEAGARAEVVGSLRSGLLCRHLDIDLHVYTPAPLRVEESFAVMARIARNPRIRLIEYANLLDAEDCCLEWHAQYEDRDGRVWQIDMIHMEEGSPWAGYFERVADRIAAVLTAETREAILRLKYETPEGEKIPGIVYYRAVLEGGVRDAAAFENWLENHPAEGIMKWIP